MASSWTPHLCRAGGRPIQAAPRGQGAVLSGVSQSSLPAARRPPACLPTVAAVAAVAAAAKTEVEKRARKHFSFFFFPLSLFKPGENESAATLLVQNK